MKKLWESLQGKKTYLTAGAMIVYAGLGLVLNYLDATKAAEIFFAALALVGVKSAITKLE